MKLVAKVKSKSDLESLKNRVRAVRIQLPRFQAVTIRKLSNQIILEAIHKRMNERGFSQKIIDGTIVSNIEVNGDRKFRVFITSTYFTETGFDVALSREKGTEFGVLIEPVRKQALRFIDEGVVKFSKGHRRDGMQAFNTVADTIDERTSTFIEAYNREKKEWIVANLGSEKVAI